MRPLSTQQFADMMQHLQGDFSTVRVAFKGGHRETLILLHEPSSDGLVTGETYGGNRIEFDMDDVTSVTYIQRDEKVMAAADIQTYKPNITPAAPADGPVRARRGRKKAGNAGARQGDERPEKS